MREADYIENVEDTDVAEDVAVAKDAVRKGGAVDI